MKRLWMLCLCVCLTLCGCADSAPLTKSTFALDTYCTVTLYDGEETVLDDCIAHLTAREQLWSKTIASSDVAKLNAAGTATVNAATSTLLRLAGEIAADTDGAFDITTAPLTDVWKAAEEVNCLPTEETLAAALDKVGSERVEIDGTTVTLENGAAIDLGGIAKGHIADELAELICDRGVTSALVDLGGNIVAVGQRTDGKPFEIGIVHPADETKLAATVAVDNAAVVTSGSYIRGYDIDGVWYSHILDPKTGMPIDNELASVTIIAPKAATADALATACFAVGYEKALTILSRFEQTEAVFVFDDGTVKATDGVTLV